jgi:hypothetical protein
MFRTGPTFTLGRTKFDVRSAFRLFSREREGRIDGQAPPVARASARDAQALANRAAPIVHFGAGRSASPLLVGARLTSYSGPLCSGGGWRPSVV